MIVNMVISNWWEVLMKWRVEWRFALMAPGGPSVTIAGTEEMLRWCANILDFHLQVWKHNFVAIIDVAIIRDLQPQES